MYNSGMIPPITMSYTEARQNLASAMRRCVDDCSPVIITSKQRKVVMLPYDEWEAELETRHQKDTPANVEHLKRSIEEIERGEVVSVSMEGLKARLKSAHHA